MLNGKFINDQALAFANRMRWEGGVAIEDRVRFGLRLVLCREPESIRSTTGIDLHARTSTTRRRESRGCTGPICVIGVKSK